MNVSELTLKLIIILIPGVMATLIYEKLTERREARNSFRLTILAVVFGFFSYISVQIGYSIFCFLRNILGDGTILYSGYLHTFRNLSDSSDIPYKEVIAASFMSFLFAYIIAGVRRYNLFNTLGRKLHLIDKATDEDLFTYYLSGDVEWVYIRDLGKKLTYKGYLKKFCERNDSKEILIKNVTVYNYEDSAELYKVSEVYLYFKTDNFIIEKATLNS